MPNFSVASFIGSAPRWAYPWVVALSLRSSSVSIMGEVEACGSTNTGVAVTSNSDILGAPSRHAFPLTM